MFTRLRKFTDWSLHGTSGANELLCSILKWFDLTHKSVPNQTMTQEYCSTQMVYTLPVSLFNRHTPTKEGKWSRLHKKVMCRIRVVFCCFFLSSSLKTKNASNHPTPRHLRPHQRKHPCTVSFWLIWLPNLTQQCTNVWACLTTWFDRIIFSALVTAFWLPVWLTGHLFGRILREIRRKKNKYDKNQPHLQADSWQCSLYYWLTLLT